MAAVSLSTFFSQTTHPTMAAPNFPPMINVAVKAARAAGAIINRAALDVGSVNVMSTQCSEFVTEVDQAVEQAIIAILLGAYPDHTIWSEGPVCQNGDKNGKPVGQPHSDHVWIIDPLNGITNFLHGLPVYCVSIALLVGGKVEQSVIYDPARNDLFTASKGCGAYMNNRRMRVAKRIRLEDCLISTSCALQQEDSLNTYLRMMGEVMQRTGGLRQQGSSALELAYVAAGLTDGFFATGLLARDVAAGSLLMTEAGGLVGNLSGHANFLEQQECIAANPRIYGQLVGLLGKYSR